MVAKMDSFDELVSEAAGVPVDGWDFSFLEGRATEQRPSWGYQRLLGRKLSSATAALDIQTGGGEVLAGAGAENFPPTLVATEGWLPNVARATALLHPLGAVVVADQEDPPLPFAEGAFDLVTSRHPASVHWSEIARVLAPGGTYFAQHVGGGANVELSEYFLGPLDQTTGGSTRSRPIRPGRPVWRSCSAETSAWSWSSSTWAPWCSSCARWSGQCRTSPSAATARGCRNSTTRSSVSACSDQRRPAHSSKPAGL